MWLWQHKNERDRLIFWTKLVGISGGAHVVLLGILFFGYRGNNVYRIELSSLVLKKEVPVVFLPLHKRITHQKKIGNNATTKTLSQQPGQQKSEKTKPAVQQVSQNTSLSAQEKKGTQLVAEKSVSSKKATKVKSVNAAKKTVPIEKKEQNKKVIAVEKKKTQQLKTEELKKEIPAVHPKPQEILPTVQEAPEIPVPQTANPVQSAEQIDENVLYVGQEEKIMMQLQQALHDEVVLQWQVPAGLSKDLTCQISVVVNWQGGIERVNIISSSGSRMYDISARTAAAQMKLPKITWGKEFIITFKQ